MMADDAAAKHAVLSLEEERALLEALCNTRPIGVAKSFKLISMLKAINAHSLAPSAACVSASQIRSYLDKHYDTATLDALADEALFHTVMRQRDFSLPVDEFPSVASSDSDPSHHSQEVSPSNSTSTSHAATSNGVKDRLHPLSLQISAVNAIEGKRRRVSVSLSTYAGMMDDSGSPTSSSALSSPLSGSHAPSSSTHFEEEATGVAISTTTSNPPSVSSQLPPLPPQLPPQLPTQIPPPPKKRGRPRIDRGGSDASTTADAATAAAALGSGTSVGGSSPALAASVPVKKTYKKKEVTAEEKAEKAERAAAKRREKVAEKEREKLEKSERAESESRGDTASIQGWDDDEDEAGRRRSRRTK
ncbi:hypothetical protein BJ741DRAFT_633461 [Chytriomyces cf. hyalinus JEL632]|nr:hypothetical protein BJ741DRAFT_633461 [Chytriomyces cf. hyalinus JEL632]